MSVGPQLSGYVYAIGNIVSGNPELRGYGWALASADPNQAGNVVGELHYAFEGDYVRAPGPAGQDITQMMVFMDHGATVQKASRDAWKTWLLAKLGGAPYSYHMGNVRRIAMGSTSETWAQVTANDPPVLPPAPPMAQIHQGYVASAGSNVQARCVSRDAGGKTYREVWTLTGEPTTATVLRLAGVAGHPYGVNFTDAAAQAATRHANGLAGYSLRFLAKLQTYTAIPF